MNTYWKSISWLIVGCLPLIGVVGMQSTSLGQHSFVPTTYGGVEDLDTGLIWGADINITTHTVGPESHVADFYYAFSEDPVTGETIPPPGLQYAGIDPVTGEPYTDWRLPTVGEMLTAVENGLLDQIDFSYEIEGRQDANYVHPNGLQYGEREYWSTCIDKYRGINRRYKFKFGFGLDSGIAPTAWMESGGGNLIAVRGKPANHSNCPGKHARPFEDDPASSLAINDVRKKEGNNGATFFAFTVTRTGDLNASVDLYYETEDDSATSGDDYESDSGTLILPADSSSQRIEIIVYGDSNKEPHERFFVNISTTTTGVTVTDSQGIGTIRNDDRR